MFKIKNFMLRRNNEDRRTSHNDKTNDKASEKKANGIERRRKKRADKTARVKWGRGKPEANGK